MSLNLIAKTTIQDKRRINNFAYSLLLIVISLHSVFSQATVPVLNLQAYDPTMMSEVYGQSYFMNTLSSWAEQVSTYQGLIRASWESAADSAINQYVATITTSDSYNSVADYQDYVRLSLRSQEEEALNEWEQAANIDMLENKNAFLARLSSGRVDEVYLNRLVTLSEFGGNPADSSNGGSKNSIDQARNYWEDSINQLLAEGTNDFSNSEAEIKARYEQTQAALDASDLEFRNNLARIDSYKRRVEGAISTLLNGFETDYNADCKTSDDCAYRYGNYGSLNPAGLLLKKYVTDIRSALNQPATTTSFSLTSLAMTINGFLSSQSTTAGNEFNRYDKLMNTYQTSLSNIRIIQDLSIKTLSLTSLQNDVKYGRYEDIIVENLESEWTSDPAKEFGNSTNLTKDVVNAILNPTGGRTSQQSINEFIQASLGSNRLIVGDVYYNLLTKDYNMSNKAAAGDILAWLSISKGSFDCGFGCTDPSPALHGNMLVDAANGVDFSKYRLNRGGFWNDYRMDHITYALTFQMKDRTMESYATYWSGIKTSMGQQLNSYEMQITPAISAWETQVKDYKDFYDTWKVQADLARVQAKVDYDKSLADLESKRQVWLSKVQNEYQTGVSNWETLSAKASVATSQGELASIQSNAKALLSNIDGVPTGASDVLDKYNDSVTALSSRSFSFSESNSSPYENGFNNQISSLSKGNEILNADYQIKGSVKNLGYDFEIASASKISGVADKLGSFGGVASSLSMGTATKSYSLFGAAAEKTINTSVSVNGKDISEIFQTTTNGVYQY